MSRLYDFELRIPIEVSHVSLKTSSVIRFREVHLKSGLTTTLDAFILKSTRGGRGCSVLASRTKLRDRLRGSRFVNKSEEVLA